MWQITVAGIRGAQSFVTARMMRSVKPTNLAFLIAAIMITAIASLAFLSIAGDDAEAGTTITIEVSSNKFCTPGQSPCPDTPLDTTVPASVGNTISFQLVSGGHTASACTDDTFTDCTGNLFDFNTGAGDWLIPAGANDSSVYFRCNVHPSSMRALIVVGNPTTPTVSPPSPTASPPPSPTETATPTPTTPATATPAPTLSGRSDVNCDGETNGDDVLALLLHSADATPAAAPLGNGCAPIGSANGDGAKGDLNCDGLVNARDALVALYGWAGLPVPGLPQGCPGP